jgi:secreted Zn-dependent insulinase-like peptidase
MRLVVIGAFSLDTLQDQVIKCFSEVPSLPRTIPVGGQGADEGLTQDATPPSSSQPTKCVFSWDDTYESPMKHLGMPLTQQCLYDRVFYVPPVKDRHVLIVTWQIPSQVNSWRSKPCDYLGHLLGHEAQGSILASLKTKSWATGCCAGVGSDGLEVRNTGLISS